MVNLMKKSFVSLTNEALTLKWLLVGVIIFAFGLNERVNILREAVNLNVYLNKWDFFITVISNLYVILYFIFPLLLFIMIRLTIQDFEYNILIRIGSYKKWIYRVQKKFFKYLFLILVIWIGCAALLTLGIPYSIYWSEGSKIETVHNLSWSLRSKFATPIIAAIAQILVFSITIQWIQLVFSLVYTFSKNKIAISLIGVFTYLGAIISFKILPASMQWVALPNYLSVYHGISNLHSFFTIILILMGLIILSVFAVVMVDKPHILTSSMFSKMGVMIYALLCIVGILFEVINLQDEKITIGDILIETFQGTSHAGYSYLSYLYYIIVYFGFLYLVFVYLEREISGISYYKIIRYRSFFKWFWSWFGKICVAVISLLCILVIVTCTIASIAGYTITFKSNIYHNLSVNTILYHFLINGFLQLMFYVLMGFIVSWVSDNSLSILILIGLLCLVLLPGINVVPVGLNGFGHILIGESSYSTTILLVVFIVLQSLMIYWLFNKKELHL
ncbi:hypothetical protein [Sporosarcina trichiuri]|uniref:hypothetical protein n=1 Tax=Sporosarcina trichiuri TaxID=3056445 RepID=UPI0025B3B4C5|nr:hypothetical protein [Sporosarcina sp. 0.2-SM1T-5]WJY26566.1 hypothetical protein QWT68_10790 [Sporosarcina sp. 0.2-SM1T-5]